MVKIKYYQIVLVLLILVSNLFSQIEKNYYHPLSNSFVLTLGGGSNYPLTDYENPGIGWLFSGGLEYYFTTKSNHILGIGINGGMQNISSELNNLGLPTQFNTDIIRGGAELVYSYMINETVLPFLSIGGSYNLYYFDSKSIQSRFFEYSNGEKTNSIVLDAKSGIKVNIADGVSLDFGLGYHYVLNDNIDAISVGDYKDFFVSGQVGISFTMWSRVDSDGDGVLDEVDQCPNEAEDMDGFEDGDGCPDYDNDGDGILDINDGCQNLKEDIDGYKDEDGCPDVDNDGDGILDVDDKCPNNKEDIDGFEDGDGCPEVDNDNDGILDIDDECRDKAEVFNGYKDEDGCPDEAPKQTYFDAKPKKVVKPKTTKPRSKTNKSSNAPVSFLVRGESTFLANSFQIKSSAYSELNKIVNQLKLYPKTRWSIEAHVDRAKSNSEAIKISKNQADAILNYLISNGLPASNFRTIGKGDSSPIASNSSVYGRMKNRRIIIKKIN
ncbi:MAG: OmpA family protein [Ignavibacteriae bacterium]|nr:OmpA family protein [Ignavibacteriota bacterium]